MNYTILAVDDEPANLRMLERLFHKDYRVLTATSGENALAILQRESVSLIITDQRMPGMTGTELLRESLRTNPDTIKIILTGYTDVSALTDAINSTRIYKFVSKPWDPITLKQTVRDAFREHETVIRQKQLVNDLMKLARAYPDIFNAERAQTDALDGTTSFDILHAGVEKPVN
ncbi:MAG TPA: response regulator [Blastocatellia bacterium]|nr:response regulator [Blastocatellia bacterium]